MFIRNFWLNSIDSCPILVAKIENAWVTFFDLCINRSIKYVIHLAHLTLDSLVFPLPNFVGLYGVWIRHASTVGKELLADPGRGAHTLLRHRRSILHWHLLPLFLVAHCFSQLKLHLCLLIQKSWPGLHHWVFPRAIGQVDFLIRMRLYPSSLKHILCLLFLLVGRVVACTYTDGQIISLLNTINPVFVI